MTQPVLVIDAGHGGDDPGATRIMRVIEEDDLVLQISFYQQQRFAELGVRVDLTRADDVTVELDPRAQMVKNSGARVCISNHINAGGGTGAEVIVSLYSDQVWGGLVLAALQAAGAGSRRVYTKEHPTLQGKDYYAMQRKTGSVETIIVEYGFIDSADITGLLDRWKYYAEAVIKATCEYMGWAYSPPVTSAPQPAPARPYGIPANAEDYQVKAFLDLVDAKIITEPETWGPKLLEPAPVGLVFTLIDKLMKEGK